MCSDEEYAGALVFPSEHFNVPTRSPTAWELQSFALSDGFAANW